MHPAQEVPSCCPSVPAPGPNSRRIGSRSGPSSAGAQRGSIERSLPWLILALALIAGVGGFFASKHWFAQPVLSLLLYPTPKPVPDFVLSRGDGSELRAADWQGSWRLLFFGFANCPDVCPTALATSRTVVEQVARQRPEAPLRVTFVSVDPERDSLEQLASYVAYFDPQFEAATGSQEQLLALTRALGVVYMKVPTGTGPFDYTIDHSASILLIDPQGRLAALARPPQDPAALSADLVRLIDARKS